MQVLRDAEVALSRSEAKQRAQLEQVEAALEKEKQVRLSLCVRQAHISPRTALFLMSDGASWCIHSPACSD